MLAKKTAKKTAKKKKTVKQKMKKCPVCRGSGEYTNNRGTTRECVACSGYGQGEF